MLILISGIVTLVSGIIMFDLGIPANIYFLIGGGFLSLIGVLLLSTFFIISYIEDVSNKNISALNEIIIGLSNISSHLNVL